MRSSEMASTSLDCLKARLKEVQLERTAKQLRLLSEAESKLKRMRKDKRGFDRQDTLNFFMDKKALLEIRRSQLKGKSADTILGQKIKFRESQLIRIVQQIGWIQQSAALYRRQNLLEWANTRIGQLCEQRDEVQLILEEHQNRRRLKSDQSDSCCIC